MFKGPPGKDFITEMDIQNCDLRLLQTNNGQIN